MIHSGRGAGCPSTSPTKRLAWDTGITGGVQWGTCNASPFWYWFSGMARGQAENPKHELLIRHFRTKFYDLWLSQVTKGLSGIAFPDVIELTRKINMIGGPIRTPYDIRSFKCLFGRDSVMVRSWSGDLPASGFPCDLMGFPSWNYFWLICPCSALTSQYPRYSDFLSITSLIFSRDWVKKTPQLIPLIYLNLITWFDPDYRLIASDLGSRFQELRGLLHDY